MIRILFFSFLVYLLYRLMTRPFEDFFRVFPDRRTKAKKPAKTPGAEEMVACCLCGTFISKNESEWRNGNFICKPSCRSDTMSVG